MKSFWAVLLVCLLAACATPDPASKPSVPVTAPNAAVTDTIESQPLKHLLGRKLKPIPDRPLELRTLSYAPSVNSMMCPADVGRWIFR